MPAPETAGGSLPPIAIIVGQCPLLLWGMTTEERLRRSLRRQGITDVRLWHGQPADAAGMLLIRGDYVFDPVLLADLARRPGTVLLHQDLPVAAHVGRAEARELTAAMAESRALPAGTGLTQVGPEGLSSAYNNSLRKREAPYLMPLTPATVDAAERRTFAGSYKGVTDAVTKYLWPRPALAVTRWCAAAGVRPNAVTLLSLVMVILATWAFFEGRFLLGLIAAWLMTFLDTVDGKLARVTLTSTRFGNVFDHGIDLIHPPFWYWAWVAGCESVGASAPGLQAALLLVIVGYVVQRVQEGVFIALFGLEMHIWRRFDSLFRLIVARRNPNLALLTVAALVGAPDYGMIAVAAWTAVSLVVHTIQIAQAGGARRGGRLVSWLAR